MRDIVLDVTQCTLNIVLLNSKLKYGVGSFVSLDSLTSSSLLTTTYKLHVLQKLDLLPDDRPRERDLTALSSAAESTADDTETGWYRTSVSAMGSSASSGEECRPLLSFRGQRPLWTFCEVVTSS